MIHRGAMTTPPESSFLSCEKDAELIIKKLFVESRPYSDILKRLLVINTKDCLDMSNTTYDTIVRNISVQQLLEKQYVTLIPKVQFEEHPEVQAYVIISFDNFTPNATNPQFRDCTVHFDIMCYTDYWDLGDYKLRPVKIAGYIDGILNNCKLTGIGTFNFLGGSEVVYNEMLAGYTLMYRAVHGSDDLIESAE